MFIPYFFGQYCRKNIKFVGGLKTRYIKGGRHIEGSNLPQHVQAKLININSSEGGHILSGLISFD